MDSSKKHIICKEMCNIVDLSCRTLIHKSLPNNVIRLLYLNLIKIKKVHIPLSSNSLRDDYFFNSKGNVKKKWKDKNYETGYTKFRIKRSFSNGR